MSRKLSEARTRSDVTQLEIDDICKGVNNVLIKPAVVSGISTYKRHTVNCIRKRANQYINNPWYSKECRVKRLGKQNRLQNMNCPNVVQELKWLSKQYKKYIISTKKA